MTEPTVNVPLLRKAVEWAEAEAAKPAELCEWEQGAWSTTAEDVAWARGFLADGERAPAWVSRIAEKSDDCGTCFCIAGFINAQHGNRPSDYKAAAELLGLPVGIDVPDLFKPSNTIEDVRRIAESIAGERL